LKVCADPRGFAPAFVAQVLFRPPAAGIDLRPLLQEDQLLQLRVLRFGFLQDRNVGVGVFPQREEVLVSGAALDAVTR
jgi:hypothetical protein